MVPGEKALRVVVFVTGLGEFLTSFVMLFLAGLYSKIYGLPADFDPYYLRQIGMFQFLVGGYILVGSFDVANRTHVRFALAFHLVSLTFESIYVLFILTQHDLQFFTMLFFIAYHIPMAAVLVGLMRRLEIDFF